MSEVMGLDPADWAMWREMTTMRSSVDRALEQRLQRDAGISGADFDILHSLSVAEGNRLRAGALAESLGWEKSRISHQVRRMADRGLVERADCPTDLRGTWVVLTAAGADAFATASCGYVETLQGVLFSKLDEDDRASLRRVARTVVDGLLATDAQPSPTR
ncbi:MarR family winged helix-turn-helix transcriptional regulator [Amnibacterium kyonggiense]|uniref:DNA-binding MarR family transcriptional regulator n=1 Tax=Amnibacterium kyonggiense TaxID=595671 RepID=A0A4R7FPA8_9MICO|nr:MarR family transcriptional regulator [Amnibacterium kyonggiense]TDS79571.1 DNA-binding MarR family transcriptional regulator [Amnibacterium kyonggiense]